MNFPFHFIIPTDKIAEGCRQFKKWPEKLSRPLSIEAFLKKIICRWHRL
jgi:hypothetical protein